MLGKEMKKTSFILSLCQSNFIICCKFSYNKPYLVHLDLKKEKTKKTTEALPNNFSLLLSSYLFVLSSGATCLRCIAYSC